MAYLFVSSILNVVLSLSLVANPLTALSIAILGLAAAMTVLIEKLRGAKTAQDKANDSIKETTKEIAKEQGAANRLFNTLKDLTKSTDERKAALDEIQKTYPNYLKNAKLEELTVNDINTAQERLNDTLRKGLIIKRKNAAIMELENKKIDIELRMDDIKANGFDALDDSWWSWLFGEKAHIVKGKDNAVAIAMRELSAQQSELQKEINETERAYNTVMSGGDIIVVDDGFAYLCDEEDTLTRITDGEIMSGNFLKNREFKIMGKVKEIICE